MNSQQMRILIAGVLAVGGLISVTILAAIRVDVPPLLEVFSTGSMFYLFGVVTNGSGMGGTKPPAGTP